MRAAITCNLFLLREVCRGLFGRAVREDHIGVCRKACIVYFRRKIAAHRFELGAAVANVAHVCAVAGHDHAR